MINAIVISGSMGAGKTTVMAEASDLLASRGTAHAAIDLDALGIAYLPHGAAAHDLMFRNVRAVWANYAAAGLDRLLIAGAVENRAMLDRLGECLPGAQIVVARLQAPVAVMAARVRLREPGMHQARFVARVVELEQLLDAAALDAFVVVNEGDITQVARDVLVRAGWL